jgi:hypothetical protein
MGAVSGPPPELGGLELAAVARLWRASRREVVCRFGGRSMSPAVSPQAEVRLCCGEEGRTGDVIAFLDGGRLVVHRIVAVSAAQGWILTRGDARLLPDTPIRRAENVIGRVAGVRQGDGFADLPPPTPSALRRAVLWPLVGALRLSPAAGTHVIAALVNARRTALTAAALLRAAARRVFRAGGATG